MKKVHFSDYLERNTADALTSAGIKWVHESQYPHLGSDFFLPDYGIYIEIKQFHSDRAIRQLSDKDNAILLQGKKAVEFFCEILSSQNRKELHREEFKDKPAIDKKSVLPPPPTKPNRK